MRAAPHASPATARIVRLLVNLPLSLLTGLADGLALKDRATRLGGRDSPQLMGPPLSNFSCGWRLSGSARRSVAKVSRIPVTTDESTVQPRTFATDEISQGPGDGLLHILRPMPSALVTGAGRGMGLEIARRLVGRGYEVAVTDVDDPTAAAEQLGERSWPLALDVTDTEACRAAASQVVERSGSLDVWVNNAGILSTGLAFEQDMDVHRRMLEVNAVGTMNGTLAAIERMRPAGRGQIINLISLAGLAAATGIVGYSASKHAAIAFSLGTAADLRRAGLGGIRISCVCPDGVWTPMIADRLDDPNDALSFSGVMLMPEQVAEHVDRLLDKPKAVLTIPRWRGRFARFFDRHPDLSLRATPLLMRDALRRQRAFKKKVESGKWPPSSR